MKNADKISVMLVDDHAIWRGGVKSMLEGTEFSVIGEASSGREAIELAVAIQPQLVLLDIRMHGGDGLDALHTLKHDHPKMAVVMLTTYDNPTFMARAVAGGAAGYLLKGIERHELLTSLRRVMDGDMLLTAQDLTRTLRGISEHASSSPDLVKPLTHRELEVLQLVATGLPNSEIAKIMFVAESTIKTHVEHIIEKIGVSDRVQAAVWAVRQGLVAIDVQ